MQTVESIVRGAHRLLGHHHVLGLHGHDQRDRRPHRGRPVPRCTTRYSRADLQPGVQTLDGQQAPGVRARPPQHAGRATSRARRTGAGCSWRRSPSSRRSTRRIRPALFTWIGAGHANTDTTMPLNEVHRRSRSRPRHPGREACRTWCCPGAHRWSGALSVVMLDTLVARTDLHRREARRGPEQEERAAEPHRERVAAPSHGRPAQTFVSTYAT